LPHNDLADRASQGDEGALGQLFDQFSEAIYRRILRAVRDPHVADDLAQDVWVRVAVSIRKFTRVGGGFVPWLHSIASSVVLDHYRRSQRRLRAGQSLYGMPDYSQNLGLEPAHPGPGPEQLAATAETAQEIVALMGTLAPMDQSVLTLRFFDGLSIAETAEVLGITPANVKVRQHRSLRKLKESLHSRNLWGSESVMTGA